MNQLQRVVAETGTIPLSWAGSTAEMTYLNYGDALSPVMVALVSGLPIRRVPTRSYNPRLAAVGTIGHGFDLGAVSFWGTGSSPWKNPSAPMAERQPFTVTPGTELNVCATRGPLSAKILGGGVVPYCDPVWLLPRYYRPDVPKQFELGIIIHLSELESRSLDTGATDKLERVKIPDHLKGSIKIVNTLTAIDPIALGAKTDEILSCKRILSTSLHGMVIAESYGIPCLYFATRGNGMGLVEEPLDSGALDLRIQDLYAGLGFERLPVYVQPRETRTDWTAAFDAIDRAWSPKQADEDGLMGAFPLPLAPIAAAEGSTIWAHPAIQGIQFQHDVAALRRADAEDAKARKRAL